MASTAFSYTGSVQTFVVPAGVTSVALDLYGAQGSDAASTGPTNLGGKGGRVQATIPVTPGETLSVYVGGQGKNASTGGAIGGWNGGGDGGGDNSGGGGGATDIRRGSSLAERLAVAAGGGGAGTDPALGTYGGDGGGLTGANGTGGAGYVGTGGTQSAGGSQGGALGVGGTGQTYTGGGGGGFYGGGGGTWPGGGDANRVGGGGGSSLVPAGGTTTAGARSGDGVATLTYNLPPTQPGAFTSPTSGQVVDGSVTPAWGAASDPDGTGVVYDLLFTRDNGATFTQLADNQAGTSYVHNTSGVAASTACFYRVVAIDPSGAESPVRQSPTFTVQHNLPPNAAVLGYPSTGDPIDRTSTNQLAHAFSDPNPGDTQSKFDWRYRLVGTTTWTTGTVIGGQQYLELPGGTLAVGDYERQVLTYDSLGVPAGGVGTPAWSPSGFFRADNPPPGPTDLQPINGAVIGTSTGVLQWSTPEQQAYRVRKLGDLAGAPNPADLLYDSGIISGTAAVSARNHPMTYPVNGRVEHQQVQIRRGGLWSPWSSVRNLVSYTPPALPTLQLVLGDDDDPVLRVHVQNPTVPDTPAVVSNSVYVRDSAYPDVELPVGEVLANATATWHWPSHLVTYEARVTAHATNGTSTSTGWIAAPLSIHDLARPRT